MINKTLKRFCIIICKKIPELKINLRPEKIKPDIYYKITEFFEKDLDFLVLKRIISLIV